MSGTPRRKPGRMGAHIEPFRERLLAVGYTPGTVRGLLMVMGQLGRWMQADLADGEQLTDQHIEVFVESLRSRGDQRVPRLRSTDPLVAYLRDVGVLEPRPVEPVRPVEEVVVGFRSWMIAERGLAAGTVLRYENTARRFLNERHAVAGDRFIIDLAASQVTGFLVVECGRVSAGSAKGRVAELRALLRYLFLKGLTSRSLAVAIPPVAGDGPVCGSGSAVSARTGYVTRSLRSCCAGVRRSSRSAKCSVTVIWPPQRSMRRSISTRCDRSRGPGQECSGGAPG